MNPNELNQFPIRRIDVRAISRSTKEKPDTDLRLAKEYWLRTIQPRIAGRKLNGLEFYIAQDTHIWLQMIAGFEIGRLIDRTLLYGADVPANFLSNENASILKSLTGGDPITVELKSSMAAPSLTCEFNIIVTSNSRLAVHLEGDVAAWQRRLKIIAYEKPKPANSIPDLDKQILQTEASGVLNWMLDGLYALRAANWQLALSSVQKARVDELLLESNSVNVFFAERCVVDSTAEGLTVTDAFAAYSDFCTDRGWTGLSRNFFGRDCLEAVQRIFRLTARHDITGADSKKNQRGWKGFRLLGANEEKPC